MGQLPDLETLRHFDDVRLADVLPDAMRLESALTTRKFALVAGMCADVTHRPCAEQRRWVVRCDTFLYRLTRKARRAPEEHHEN